MAHLLLLVRLPLRLVAFAGGDHPHLSGRHLHHLLRRHLRLPPDRAAVPMPVHAHKHPTMVAAAVRPLCKRAQVEGETKFSAAMRTRTTTTTVMSIIRRGRRTKKGSELAEAIEAEEEDTKRRITMTRSVQTSHPRSQRGPSGSLSTSRRTLGRREGLRLPLRLHCRVLRRLALPAAPQHQQCQAASLPLTRTWSCRTFTASPL
jgi:hypothetical protein